MIQTLAKELACRASTTRIWDAMVRRLESQSAQRGWLRVLAYHRIDTPGSRPTDYPGLISATPEQFQSQMEFLAKNYSVVSLEQTLESQVGQVTLPSNSVLLTFDDATVDFAEHAWPILKSLNLPVTVFVPTAYPDEPSRHFWWNRLYRAVCHSPTGTRLPTPNGQKTTIVFDRQRAPLFRAWRSQLKSLPHAESQWRLQEIVDAGGVPDPDDNGVLSWDSLRALHRDGVTLAPHTHTHPMLNQLPRDQIREEILTSRALLSQELGDDVPPALAFPAGGFNADVTTAIADAGFRLGFTTQRGLNSIWLDAPLQLKRINIGGNTTLGLLRLQLANWGLLTSLAHRLFTSRGKIFRFY